MNWAHSSLKMANAKTVFPSSFKFYEVIVPLIKPNIYYRKGPRMYGMNDCE